MFLPVPFFMYVRFVMCVATGPVQYVWEVVETHAQSDVHGFRWGIFSREDWANDAVSRWSKNHPLKTFKVEKVQVDWWMRCH
jgi:hypothetical protein